MKRIPLIRTFRIMPFVLVVFTIGSCSLRSNNKVKYTEDELFTKLESIYVTYDTIKLTKFLNEWSRIIKPNELEDINRDITTKMVYDIYEAFYIPTSPFYKEMDIRFSEDCKYVVIQNKIEFNILPDSDFKKYESVLQKNDTLFNFKPRLKFEDKKVLYLTDEYNNAIKKFIDKDWDEGLIPPPPLPDGTILEYKNRENFLDILMPVQMTVCLTWDVLTHPEVHVIVINNSRTKAKVYFRYGQGGGESVLEKEDDIWIVKETKDTWIE